MADDIIQFAPGGKVTAEETNENNLLLKEWALDNSQSEAYIDGKIATLTSNLNSQISSLNSQIATKAPLSNPTLTGTVKVPNSAEVGTAVATAAISKAGNGYVKFGNGIMIQWGTGSMKNANTTITFPTAFGSTARVSLTKVTNSDSRTEDWWVKSVTKTNFVVRSSETDGLHYIAVGY
jgi:hypothetical protein